MKDRFSLHIHDGQPDILEAVTVLRNGSGVEIDGSGPGPGLFGITNISYQPSSDTIPSAILPETIFNVQAVSGLDARFSSHNRYSDTSLQLFSNGNIPASGLEITYSPVGDSASIDFAGGGGMPVFTSVTNNPVVHMSLVRASGISGVKYGFLSATEKGYVGIGTTHIAHGGTQTNILSINDPLTIYYSGASNSGTIALKEQADRPSTDADFGKIYVKPKITGDQTQSLFFLDDGGSEFDIIKSRFDYFDGVLYGDRYGNTFGGWYCPYDRTERSDRLWNTIVGHAAGSLLTDGDANTVLGYFAGSGMNTNVSNTVIGAVSYTHAREGDGNIIIGYKNASPSDVSSDIAEDNFSRSILIGTGLYISEEPEDDTLAIGHGSTPLILGALGSTRSFSVKSTPSVSASLSVDGNDLVFGFSNKLETDRHATSDRKHSIIDIKDTTAELDSESMLSLRFSNEDSISKTLVDFDPSGTLNPSTINFTEPTFKTPNVSVSGDLRLLGSVRFADGTVLSTADTIDVRAATGIAKTVASDGNSYFHLSFENTLTNATSLTAQFDTSTAQIAVEVPDASTYKVGKMTLDSLTNYLASGYATAGENCNMIFTDNKYTFDTVNNSRSVVIGCDTASYATGWKNSIMIGNQAGYSAVVANTSLATDTACIFIGDRAGYDSDSSENAVFIGSSAGKNADSSSNSIFIGNSAGLNSTNPSCIGIGDFALAGDEDITESEQGERNIEIVAGKLTNQRLMYELGNLSDRLNIQNSIAGYTAHRFISIGDARLAPECPLEVRRNETIDGHNSTVNIQTWFNDTGQTGRVNVSGDFVSNIVPSGRDAGPMSSESWFGNIEGFMVDYIYSPSDYNSATSGLMTVKDSSFNSAEQVMIVNRDPKLNIHGAGAVGGAAYVIATRINGEFRPIYVSCSGS